MKFDATTRELTLEPSGCRACRNYAGGYTIRAMNKEA